MITKMFKSHEGRHWAEAFEALGYWSLSCKCFLNYLSEVSAESDIFIYLLISCAHTHKCMHIHTLIADRTSGLMEWSWFCQPAKLHIKCMLWNQCKINYSLFVYGLWNHVVFFSVNSYPLIEFFFSFVMCLSMYGLNILLNNKLLMKGLMGTQITRSH